jgi:hypothetical protein
MCADSRDATTLIDSDGFLLTFGIRLGLVIGATEHFWPQQLGGFG